MTSPLTSPRPDRLPALGLAWTRPTCPGCGSQGEEVLVLADVVDTAALGPCLSCLRTASA